MKQQKSKLKTLKEFTYKDFTLGEKYLSTDEKLRALENNKKSVEYTLVAVSHTFQAKSGNQIRVELKHDSYFEDENEE